MNTFRNNPDGEENQQATKESASYIGGLKLKDNLMTTTAEAEFKQVVIHGNLTVNALSAPHACSNPSCIGNTIRLRLEKLDNLESRYTEIRSAFDSITAERDALMEACQIAADWLSRSTRIDDREQADDLRAAILKARGGES